MIPVRWCRLAHRNTQYKNDPRCNETQMHETALSDGDQSGELAQSENNRSRYKRQDREARSHSSEVHAVTHDDNVLAEREH
eukprot:CAMPEP_0197395002 /NCGR_PEP_ID=MMETSP1165-20131217/6282_1 /TAXON_ID=284809 /ORGANISM="Chrysocystis fragilis, Strain CCMP3189" /LENGTH=80 /DNA_ID=CAMNT_0042920745 /DNA_START=791 /DNA_END=1033 /DNA_ORIENTATION=+